MIADISVEVPVASSVAACAGKMSRLAELAVGYITGCDLTVAEVRTQVVRERRVLLADISVEVIVTSCVASIAS